MIVCRDLVLSSLVAVVPLVLSVLVAAVVPVVLVSVESAVAEDEVWLDW